MYPRVIPCVRVVVYFNMAPQCVNPSPVSLHWEHTGEMFQGDLVMRSSRDIGIEMGASSEQWRNISDKISLGSSWKAGRDILGAC
jgi:hypothetical protein